jgi:hypothetical protein
MLTIDLSLRRFTLFRAATTLEETASTSETYSGQTEGTNFTVRTDRKEVGTKVFHYGSLKFIRVRPSKEDIQVENG